MILPTTASGWSSSRQSSRKKKAITTHKIGEIMTVLRQGSSGPDVTNLQQKLKDLGFDPNAVDGDFGPGTRDAVIAFQQSNGLQADGIAGPATLAALGLGDGSANADAANSATPDTASSASTDTASSA